MKLIAVIMFVVLASTAQAETAKSYSSAKIFFVPWDLLTRANLNPEHVREMAWVVTEIDNDQYVNTFVSWLKLNRLSEKPRRNIQDFRLVIDLTKDDNSVETYLSDGQLFCSSDLKKCRTTDEIFRKAFSPFEETTKKRPKPDSKSAKPVSPDREKR